MTCIRGGRLHRSTARHQAMHHHHVASLVITLAPSPCTLSSRAVHTHVYGAVEYLRLGGTPEIAGVDIAGVYNGAVSRRRFHRVE